MNPSKINSDQASSALRAISNLTSPDHIRECSSHFADKLFIAAAEKFPNDNQRALKYVVFHMLKNGVCLNAKTGTFRILKRGAFSDYYCKLCPDYNPEVEGALLQNFGPLRYIETGFKLN